MYGVDNYKTSTIKFLTQTYNLKSYIFSHACNTTTAECLDLGPMLNQLLQKH